MSVREIGLEILEGIQDIKAHNTGDKVLRTHYLKDSAPPQVIRSKLNLSQAAFAFSEAIFLSISYKNAYSHYVNQALKLFMPLERGPCLD
jgi:hypothetical protein